MALLVNRSPLNLRALKPSVSKATCRTITMVSAVIGVWALAFVSGYRPGSSCRTLAEVPYDHGGFCRIVKRLIPASVNAGSAVWLGSSSLLGGTREGHVGIKYRMGALLDQFSLL